MKVFNRDLVLGLGISLFLLLISSAASYISIKNLINSSRMLRESNHVISALDNTTSLIKDAETGQRGYLLTGDTRFLDPYNASKGKIETQLDELDAVFSKSPSQSGNLKELKKSVDARITILDQNLEDKKQNNNVTNEQLFSGKKHMDDIRRIVSLMQKEEEALLEKRTETMNTFAKFTPWLIIFSSLLAIVITLLFYRKVAQDFDEKSNLAKELEGKNKESADRLQAIEKVAQQISVGDYNIIGDEKLAIDLGNVAGSTRWLKIFKPILQHLKKKSGSALPLLS